jgi:hypothetical protein
MLQCPHAVRTGTGRASMKAYLMEIQNPDPRYTGC